MEQTRSPCGRGRGLALERERRKEETVAHTVIYNAPMGAGRPVDPDDIGMVWMATLLGAIPRA